MCPATAIITIFRATLTESQPGEPQILRHRKSHCGNSKNASGTRLVKRENVLQRWHCLHACELIFMPSLRVCQSLVEVISVRGSETDAWHGINNMPIRPIDDEDDEDALTPCGICINYFYTSRCLPCKFEKGVTKCIYYLRCGSQ